MRAVGLMVHGGSDVLQLVDVPEVHAGPGQVRGRVHAAAVNPTDTIAVDPICFDTLEQQIDALDDLRSCVRGPFANPRGRGRPSADFERILHHCLAVAYARDTGKKGSESSTEFLAVCEEIKRIYALTHWNPESIPRSARRFRQLEK